MYTWTQDPASIVVNSVTASVLYDYNGSCTTDDLEEYSYTYYQTSGWYKSYSPGEYNSNSCAAAVGTIDAEFQNAVFPACLGSEPFAGPCSVTYNTEVMGLNNGGRAGYYNTTYGSNGGDALLTSYEELLS